MPNPALAGVLFYLVLRDLDKRSYIQTTRGGNTAKPLKRASTQDSHKNRLCLVVEVMSGSYPPSAVLFSTLFEKLKPFGPSPLLNGLRPPLKVASRHSRSFKANPELSGRLLYKTIIPLRLLPPKLMVQMTYNKPYTKLA